MSDTALKAPRKRSAGQMLVIGLVILLIGFLIIGTVNEASSGESANAFGVQSQPFLVLSILAFAGGLLSFASPCTLPILPAYFAFAFRSGRTQIAANTLSFMMGVALMFSLLGLGASFVGQFLLRNQTLILLIGGSFIMVFGVMSLMGKGFSGVTKDDSSQPERGIGGSFLFGLTFSVGWSTCIGPILGAVLSLAANVSPVRGFILLFIYAMGLGLPLLIVSTFFGRTSRKSLFWRILRGKGWQVETHMMLVGIVWALAIWRILVAVVKFAFFNDPFNGPEFTTLHSIGLLAVALAGVALWVFTSPGKKRTTVELHSTQLISGGLFILMAVLMLDNHLAAINRLVSESEIAVYFANLEDRIIEWLGTG